MQGFYLLMFGIDLVVFLCYDHLKIQKLVRKLLVQVARATGSVLRAISNVAQIALYAALGSTASTNHVCFGKCRTQKVYKQFRSILRLWFQ